MSGQNSSKSKIDVIVSWPRHMDYPLWRKFISDNRGRFEKVCVVFTYMNVDKDYRAFIKEAMAKDNITFMNNNPVLGSEDWRNVAVNKALGICQSEWVWFTEQDFFCKEGFWDEVNKAYGAYNYIAAETEGRVHPCCIFLKREVLNKTRQDFGVIPNVADHFSKLQQDLVNEPFYEIPKPLYYHMNGLSQDMWQMQNGLATTSPKEKIVKYVRECLEPGIINHPDFERMFNEYIS